MGWAEGKGIGMARKNIQHRLAPAEGRAAGRPASIDTCTRQGLGSPDMPLREFFTPESVKLPLTGTTQDEILAELVGLLGVDERTGPTLLKVLKRREELGSTGVGRGIAIPHGRSLVVTRLRLAFGHLPGGIDYRAIDDKPVYHFFLIVAPPVEISNQYLPVLGKIAQFAKEPDVPERLAGLQSSDDFFRLLEEKGV